VKRIGTVRLYPTASQDVALHHALHVTRHLYNAALQQRKDADRLRGVSVSMKMQYAEVTALREHLAGIYRECEDAVLRRLDLAMQAFFRRRKPDETPGFSRFRAARRWRQITYPHGDRARECLAGNQRWWADRESASCHEGTAARRAGAARDFQAQATRAEPA